jgi:Sigma-70, region 4
MQELDVFCARILGTGDAATQAALQARGAGGEDRIEQLAAAVATCRTQGETAEPESPRAPAAAAPGLAETVALELAAATARLPQDQREALASRELLGLSHEQVARVVGIECSAVAPLLAQARLALRTQVRGAVDRVGECPEHDRALRTMSLRQDSEPLSDGEEGWLLEHLGECVVCNRSHAAMLEASVCYRAWQVNDRRRERQRAGGSIPAAGDDAGQ